MSNKEQEIWRVYPDYPFIEASNLGIIRTKDRVVTGKDGKKYHIKGHVLRQRLRPDGYMDVTLSMNGKKFNLYVHRVIAASHLPNPNNLLEVNHIDCDRTNNRSDNLEWCTHQENIAHRDKLGHTAKHNAPKKPVIAVNPETSEVFWFESQCEAGRQLGVFQQHIKDIIKGRRNTTHGYYFCNADETAVEKVRSKFGDNIANKVEKLLNENHN